MVTTGTICDLSIDLKSHKEIVTFSFDKNAELEELELLKGYKLNIELKKWFKRRTKNANSYLWALIEKMAEKLNMSRIEVYRHHIYEAGTYIELQMDIEAIDTFAKQWESNGIGWFCETDVNEYDEIVVKAYNGSSSYNTKEMSRLLDSVIQDCKALGIETKSDREIKSLLENWEEKCLKV